MSKVFISFEAHNPAELQRLVMNYALERDTPSSLRSGVSLDNEALQAHAEEQEAYQKEIDEDDAEYAKGNGADAEPAVPEPPAKRARAARAPRVSVAPPVSVAPAAAPPVDLPPLDTLIAVVTNGVRQAQKEEGSKKILDLLPGFKEKTGLTFVMHAEDKHRAALYDLIQAAGLPVV